MFQKDDLLKLANMPMPFGKYQGRVLIDLPEEYLLWFARAAAAVGAGDPHQRSGGHPAAVEKAWNGRLVYRSSQNGE
jgi:hypothetical protein